MKEKTLVTSNFVWRFLERSGAQGVAFIVSIVLARLLAPEVYGTIALVTVFTTIMNVFVDSGLGNALIQKKEADDLDFSTVFFFNIAMCSVLYLIMYILSPYIALFYKRPELTLVIRVLSLTLVISGVKNVQQAYVSRTMQFKRFFFATLGGTLGAAVVGIILAYRGFGVWALVVQQLFNASIDTIILCVTVKWRPKRVFSFDRLKGLFSFGWKLLVSALLDTVYKDLRQLIIGKMYSSTDLAQYNRGQQFPSLIITNVNTSIDSVLLPTMSKAQDDPATIKSMTRRAMQISTYVMSPLLMGLAFCGESLIELLLTEKWLPCVPFMRIFCITFMLYPVHTANLNAIKAMGRSDMFLKLEVVKKIVGIILLVSSMWFGAMVMAYSLLLSTVINMIINSWPNKKLLNYSFSEQLKDILPGILLAVFMGICVWAVELLSLSAWLKLLIQVPLGAIIYISLSKLLKIESFEYLIGMVKPFIFTLKKRGSKCETYR